MLVLQENGPPKEGVPQKTKRKELGKGGKGWKKGEGRERWEGGGRWEFRVFFHSPLVLLIVIPTLFTQKAL